MEFCKELVEAIMASVSLLGTSRSQASGPASGLVGLLAANGSVAAVGRASLVCVSKRFFSFYGSR